jgi:hypothetical protein
MKIKYYAYMAIFTTALIAALYPHVSPIHTGYTMKIILAVLFLLSLGMLGCSNFRNQKDASTDIQKSPALSAPARPIAQVVGVIWLNPLHRRDYPTEWQLLWTQGLVKPNTIDDVVKKNPAKYSSVQAIASIAVGRQGTRSLENYHDQYILELTKLLHDDYFANSRYFYNVHDPKIRTHWRELAGIRIEYALPNEKLDLQKARADILDNLVSIFSIGNVHSPSLWTDPSPPDVRITAGGANAGFTSLDSAIDYLQQNPGKTAWAMGWDAPSRPLDEQINENLVVLILAGPIYKTGRNSLAWIARPESRNVSDVNAGGDAPRTVQAWTAALQGATKNADIQPTDIGYVIHDANNAHQNSSARLGPLAQTLTTEVPGLDFLKQSFNTPALLGEMGAGSALTNVALAIGYANHFGKHVMVAGTTELDRPTAVIVSPPAVVRPIDPAKTWFRARSMSHAYLPWWGLRDDATGQMQGYSK